MFLICFKGNLLRVFVAYSRKESSQCQRKGQVGNRDRKPGGVPSPRLITGEGLGYPRPWKASRSPLHDALNASETAGTRGAPCQEERGPCALGLGAAGLWGCRDLGLWGWGLWGFPRQCISSQARCRIPLQNVPIPSFGTKTLAADPIAPGAAFPLSPLSLPATRSSLQPRGASRLARASAPQRFCHPVDKKSGC